MPSLRPRVSAARRSLKDFNVRAKLCFISYWSPGLERGPWHSWTEYLADYADVREDMHQHFRGGSRAKDGPLFADRATAFRDAFGLEALERASHSDIRAYDPTRMEAQHKERQ